MISIKKDLMSLFEFPFIALEIRVTEELITQAFWMYRFKGGCLDALRAIDLVDQILHPLSSTDDETRVGGAQIGCCSPGLGQPSNSHSSYWRSASKIRVMGSIHLSSGSLHSEKVGHKLCDQHCTSYQLFSLAPFSLSLPRNRTYKVSSADCWNHRTQIPERPRILYQTQASRV